LVPEVRSGDTHSYWFLLVRLDSARFTADRDTMTRALSAEGVPAEAGYIPRPVYRYDVFQEHNFFGGRWPVRDFGLTDMDYRQVNCPVAEAVLADSIRFTINEAMSDAYVDQVTHAVRTILRRFSR
jgi:perosamine synthetase